MGLALQGRTAVVTGAGQGIGLGIAQALGAAGARVFVVDLSGERAETAADDICAQGSAAIAVACDVADPDAVHEMTERVWSEGGADILVNNAGVLRPALMLNMSLRDWDDVLRINLTSQFLTLSAFAPRMVQAGGGAIVNIASVAGLRGIAGSVSYAASKAGVIGLTRSAAIELAPHGIRVNAIAPGVIATAMTETIREVPELRQHFVDSIPLGRVGTPADIGSAVVFLATDASSFITGQALEVDGGAYV